MKVLVTGGAGYIGATTAHLLQSAGHEVVILDNFSSATSKKTNPPAGSEVIYVDITDKKRLSSILKGRGFDIVLHFAAKIQVGESFQKPWLYFENNTFGALNLIEAMLQNHIKRLIFSSTAAVYGSPKRMPIQENDPKQPINPYGASKWIVEQLLKSYEQTHGLSWTAFRYFNAAGAYKGIADYPCDTHIISRAVDSLFGGPKLKIMGTDYDTPDGTTVRDYVHVEDIARAHVLAAEQLYSGKVLNRAINLGTSRGSSLLELVKTLEKVTDKKIKYITGGRRPGDPAVLVASNRVAREILGWEPKHDLKAIISSAYAWRTIKASEQLN